MIEITPPKRWPSVNFHEVWEYRELLYNFIVRDIKLRYKQTVLGPLWVIIQPLFMMVVFTFVFGGFAHIPSDNIPYPLFSFAALLPWMLFSEGFTRSTMSMVNNAGIMTKVYFPRLIMPISGVISPLIDFGIAFIILICMMAYYGFIPTISVITLPLFVVLAVATSLAIGLWMSALNIKNRDFQYTVPFIIQVGMYASPIIYPISMIPDQYKMIYSLNPMVGVIDGFRWALLGTNAPGPMIFASIGVVIVALISGLFYFKKVEQSFVDVV
jgi:lipopolysaccharide transport system permease protein